MTTQRPTLADWSAKLEQDLKGRGADQLAWRTADGYEVPALATSADLEGLPHLGARDLLTSRPRGWKIRELCNDSDPVEANQHARAALAGGAEEVEFFFDALVQDALDPDTAEDPESDDVLAIPAAPGDGGVAVHTRADFDQLLAELDLATTPLWFSAGEGATAILAWWLRLADARGIAAEDLRGGLDLDPLARLSMRRIGRHGEDGLVARRTSIDTVFDEAAAWVRSCSERLPGIRPLVLDGQVHHLGGAAPGLELGATLAGIVDVARHLAERGVAFEQLARAATVRVQVGHEILPEIAKLRALRLAFARIARQFGVSGGDALLPRVLGVTSSRQRAEDFDQRTNLLRTTLAGFAAVTGGCDHVVTMPYDDTAPDDAAWTLARNQQLLLRDEGHLARVVDPFGGSFAVERLTHEIGAVAWQTLVAIEREGGLIATMQSGWLHDRLQRHEERRESAFRYRKRVLVGISRFADLELGGPAPGKTLSEADDVGDDAAVAARVARFVSWRKHRGAAPADWLAGLARPAEDLVSRLGQEAADRASASEIATACWPPEGTDIELRFLPLAGTDGHEYEELRLWSQATREAGEELPRIQLLPVGPLKWARARADFARDLFLVGGLPVDDPGHFASVEQAIAHLAEAAPPAVVLCSDDDSYPELAAAVRGAGNPAGDGAHSLLFVAGKAGDELSALVDGSVHLGMDVIAFLRELQEDLGVRTEAED